MEENTGVVNEAGTESQATEVTQSAEATSNAAVETKSQEGAAPEGQLTPEAPKYNPNFKVKVYDKEYEIPEKFRSLIADEASEKEVKEIFNKAYGLDGMKPKYQKLQETYKAVETEFGGLKQEIGKLSKYVQNGDYDSFFNSLQIPEEALKEWMIQKLQRNQLPPDQRAVYDRQQALLHEKYKLEEENQKFKSEFEMKQAEAEQIQLDTLDKSINEQISRPEIESIAKSFDDRLGKPGAFREEVINRGSLIFQRTGQNPSVEQVVSEVVSILGGASVPVQKAQEPVRGQATLEAQKKAPVIPSVGGGSSSPMKKKITSVDDIKKYNQTTYG